MTHDFALAYVAENNATVTPLLYSITGLWSALEGSILLWALLLTLATTAFVALYRDRHADAVVGWATAVLLATDAFFLGTDRGTRVALRPHRARRATTGSGAERAAPGQPARRDPPPAHLLGAGAVHRALRARRGLPRDRAAAAAEWQLETRRWALGAWTALTVGVVLGAWWSYQVLGWGGFWGWDPVENAALLPWLVGDRLRPLDRRRGATRAAPRLERHARDRGVRAHDPRDLLHPLGRPRERARVQLVHARADPARLLRAGRRARASGSWRGAATGSARPSRSTSRSAARARSSRTTCCSSASPPSSCWAPSSRSRTRRSGTRR